MNDERLTALLGSLRYERMDRIADDRTRARLENAWTERSAASTWSQRARRVAPVLATLVLVAGVVAATLRAPGDSPLYGARVAIEDAAVLLYGDPEDRAQYLLSLFDERMAEAARLEASGNALAAARVRQAEDSTLRALKGMLPEAPEVVPPATPEPTESPTPTPSPSPSPTPSESPMPVPTATLRPATPRPTSTRTPTPRPATATPSPTGTAMPVTVSGRVKNPDLSPAANVCVRVDPTSTTCLKMTGSDGTYSIVVSARLNQTVTVYFTRVDDSVLYKAYVSGVVKGSLLTMADAKLQQ